MPGHQRADSRHHLCRTIGTSSNGLPRTSSGATRCVTPSRDASAAQSYTLLSVTAVIIGGSEFVGGVVEPVGVVAGAVTLSLVGVLLSLLGVDPNFTAAVEGLILILVLAGRSLARKVRTS